MVQESRQRGLSILDFSLGHAKKQKIMELLFFYRLSLLFLAVLLDMILGFVTDHFLCVFM